MNISTLPQTSPNLIPSHGNPSKILDESVFGIFPIKEYSKNDYIYCQNCDANSVYFIEEGRVILGIQSTDGRTTMTEVNYPGDLFGELAILGDDKRNGFAKALDHKVRIRVIPRTEFLEILMEDNQTKLQFFEMIGRRMRKVNRKIEDLIMRDARSRIIGYLIHTAEEKGQKVGFEMMIKNPLRHQDIADLTGTSRQTTTTILNELKQMNLINIDRRRILIRDLDTLRSMH